MLAGRMGVCVWGGPKLWCGSFMVTPCGSTAAKHMLHLDGSMLDPLDRISTWQFVCCIASFESS
jgi:hypothetical protein